MPFKSIAIPEELYNYLDNLNPPHTKPIWKKIEAVVNGVKPIG